MGSSVPACPTFRVPAIRRILATTWCEVHPAGLSITTMPDSACSASGRLVIIALWAFLKNLVVFVRVRLARVRCTSGLLGNLGVDGSSLSQQVVNLSGVFWYGVEQERQRRGEPQTKLLANLSADQPCRRAQCCSCGGLLLLGAEHRVEHRGVATVTAETYVGHGHEAEPWILDPPLQHLRHDHFDLVGQLVNAWRAHLLLPHAHLSELSSARALLSSDNSAVTSAASHA